MASIQTVFDSVRSRMPTTLGPRIWYIITASALVACGKPDQLGVLSTYINGHLGPNTQSEKEKVSKQLRDVLMKEWTLVGIPLVVMAVASLAKAEEGLGFEESLSAKWQDPPPSDVLTSRGTSFLQTIYAQDVAPIFATWGSHRPDFECLEKNVIYGLYLSDHSVLSAVEAEAVILTAIMCQGLRAPTIWHLRGFRRLGVSAKEVDDIQKGVEEVAKWAGKETNQWARIEDVTVD